jgi:hypothetical protein
MHQKIHSKLLQALLTEEYHQAHGHTSKFTHKAAKQCQQSCGSKGSNKREHKHSDESSRKIRGWPIGIHSIEYVIWIFPGLKQNCATTQLHVDSALMNSNLLTSCWQNELHFQTHIPLCKCFPLYVAISPMTDSLILHGVQQVDPLASTMRALSTQASPALKTNCWVRTTQSQLWLVQQLQDLQRCKVFTNSWLALIVTTPAWAPKLGAHQLPALFQETP